MVASTPREFPLITANSLSSNTWRPMPKAYVAVATLLGGLLESSHDQVRGIPARRQRRRRQSEDGRRGGRVERRRIRQCAHHTGQWQRAAGIARGGARSAQEGRGDVAGAVRLRRVG